MSMRLNDPETWKDLWIEALNASANRRKRPTPARALNGGTVGHSALQEARKRPRRRTGRKRCLTGFRSAAALKEGFRVLDIGAGSGRYAIPMAKMGCKVVALEPAEAMVGYMRERVAQENLTNITILNKTWQAVDLDQDDMRGQFDLAFASMSPGIQTPDDLVKMIGASRLACYLSGHTRERWRHLENVWKDVLGHDVIEIPGDFLYRFGWYMHWDTSR